MNNLIPLMVDHGGGGAWRPLWAHGLIYMHTTLWDITTYLGDKLSLLLII